MKPTIKVKLINADIMPEYGDMLMPPRKTNDMKTPLHNTQKSLQSIATVVVMSCTAILLVSCGNKNLTRGEAAEKISRSLNLPAFETTQIDKSFVKKFWSDPSMMPAVFAGNAHEYSDVKDRLDELQAKGLISVGEIQENQGQGHFLIATVSLTDAGKKYLVAETAAGFQVKAGYQVKINEIVFGEVTGIQMNEQFKVAEVYYTLKKANGTPFGGNVSTEPIERKATFTLFDDGWRIQKLSSEMLSSPSMRLRPVEPFTENRPMSPTSNAASLHESGNQKLDKGDYDGAIADYNRAIELNPKYASAYNNRGNAKSNKRDYDGAIADYNRAIELDPKYAFAYSNRGSAKSNKRDYDGAIADFDRAIELDPKFASAYNNRGYAKSNKRDYDGAIADCNRAIELDPKYAFAYNNRGKAKKSKGDCDGAIADYNRAIELDPKFAIACYNRADAKTNIGDLNGAIADFDRAIELEPKYAVAYCFRGIVKRLKSDQDGAIADFDRAIELEPKYASAYVNRGHSYMGKGDYERAIQDWSRAIELDEKNSDALNNRGWAYCKKRDYDRAWADVKKCRELGGKVDAEFLVELTKASGRTE